jgi:uncharacterized heparinase superfamily protein
MMALTSESPRLFELPAPGQGNPWEALAERYTGHEFNVLGSGWTRVRYGMLCAGFEGINFSDETVTSDSVRRRLPLAYQATSRALSDLAGRFVAAYTPIDWHLDFKSGYRYEMAHHTQLRYGVLKGVDAKVPADLSRFYHLVPLALAWRASGDGRFRREVMAQMLDWLAFNPFEYGAAWRANMNVAIRAANWVAALSLLQDSFQAPTEDEAAFLASVRVSLVEHRQYICRNLEFPEGAFHPNHYVANLAGLIVLCGFIQGWDPEAAAWRAMALRELGREIDRQVLADGVDYEGATSYHALVLEMVSYALTLAARAEGAGGPVAVREWIAARLGQLRLETLRRMFAALRDFTQPDGRIPLVGDSDAGRFLCLETQQPDGRDWRFLSCLGAALFEDAALLPPAARPEDWASARLLLKAKEPEAWVAAGERRPESAAYRSVGFYVMQGQGFHSVISCGPIGTGGLGGHAHNDKLALTLCLGGQEVLVDPGIYVYTAGKDYRDAYRSVLAHNTVAVADEEQNRFLADSPWWGCHEDTHCECLRWESSATRDVFVGEHLGYTRLTPPLLHRRGIEWWKDENRVRITDDLLTSQAGSLLPKARWTFMLNPECRVVRMAGGVVVVQRGELTVRLAVAHGLWQERRGWYSPSYGIRRDCTLLAVELAPGPARNTVIIAWRSGLGERQAHAGQNSGSPASG